MTTLVALFPDSAERKVTPNLVEQALMPASHCSKRPSRIRIDPENTRNGLMQLVLTLVELIRELLERQALRRVDAGSLSPEEIERLGLTFQRLSEEIERLKQQFGFSDEDLNLDLGPLGKLR